MKNLNEIPIGSYVKLSQAMAAILDSAWKIQT